MSDIIVTTFEQLEEVVVQALKKVLPMKEEEPNSPPDTGSLAQAIAFLQENGYLMSKSKLYKLTSAEQIPFRHFERRLVFSRKELLEWIKSQTVSRSNSSETLLTLAKSARNKLNK
jgi:hypothetical protein